MNSPSPNLHVTIYDPNTYSHAALPHIIANADSGRTGLTYPSILLYCEEHHSACKIESQLPDVASTFC
jgi:hypothetical protein